MKTPSFLAAAFLWAGGVSSLPAALPFALPVVSSAAQAAIITQVSTREVEVRGEGANANAALMQARQKAIDKLAFEFIHTQIEEAKLKAFLPALYAHQKDYLTRLKIVGKGTLPDGGRFYVIRYRVNAKAIRSAMVAQQIIPEQSEINEALAFPTLAVYYKDPMNQSPMAEWSVQRCNSILLNQGFQVVDPKVWLELGVEDQQLSKGKAVSAQRMALKARANVFLEIDVEPQVVGSSGDYRYVQAPVKIRAFETSSGTPFLEKAYQRQDAQGNPEALAIAGSVDVSTKAVIEEAVAGVMPMIIDDLTSYWKEALIKGRQYYLSFHPPLTEAQQQQLKNRVKAYTLQKDGSVAIRYDGDLADLADQLEEQFAAAYVLDRMDLGRAHFEAAP